MAAGAPPPAVAVEHVTVEVFTIPTDQPEQDGTFDWDSTTLVLVEVRGGGHTGLGLSYAAAAAARLIADKLGPLVTGLDALSPPAAWHAMVGAVRNMGQPGIASSAIAAVDVALWDLKAQLFDRALVDLLGSVRPAVAAYGSGGFTNYSDDRMIRQIEGWRDLGLRDMKLKVGRDAARDRERIRRAQQAAGPEVRLMIDANGAHTVKQALAQAEYFAGLGVVWFEEPVSSDNLAGLARMCREGPAGMEITAGEYGYDIRYFRRMLAAEAVEVLQPDATRCGGVTGFLHTEALAEAFDVPLSAHTAPSLHAHLGCACRHVRHVEYFHDHARIEHMLFDGAIEPQGGLLRPDRSRPGLGLTFKRADAERYRV